MTGLTLKNIYKSFGSTEVLKGVDLAIRAGEFLTLVGPSGCGKSTLLRILAGLEAPASGRVWIRGQDVTGVRPSARNLAMVFQSYALYPHLSVAENMLTPLKLRDLSRRQRLPLVGPLLARAKNAELMSQVRDTAEILQIQHLLDRKPGQLSGGQRQRVALGRAMVRQPVAFLMDEPLSNLDAALRVHMRAELTHLHRRLKTTFVYVTHDQAEALTMSDRMAVMMGGDILQLGRPDDIYQDPDTLEVARFIGSPKINTFAGEVDSTGRITLLGRPLARRMDAPRGPVSLGVRSEHLQITDPGMALLTGQVSHRENLGADIYLHVAINSHAAPVVVRASPAQAASYPLDAMVAFTPVPGKVLVFGAEGRRWRAAPEILVEKVA